MDYNFPKKSQFFFMTSSIKEVFGGLTNAMLKRAKVFSEANIETSILTFDFTPDLNNIREMLKGEKINNLTKILNIYEFYCGEFDEARDYRNEHEFEEEGFNIHKVEKRNAFVFYKNGIYSMFKSYEKSNGKLKFIDYFNEHRFRTRREEFDDNGIVRKVAYMDLNLNLPTHELFYRKNGQCFISKWYKIKDGKNIVERINWFDENGDIKKVFKTELKFKIYWLDTLTNEDYSNFLIADAKSTYPLLISFSKYNSYKIFMKHSTHLKSPFKFDSEIASRNKPVFDNPSNPDAIIFLTEGQKNDVELRFGERNNYFVIPHPYDIEEEKVDFHKRDLNKVVAIARYEENKQLDHIILAFKSVIKENPKAVLELYGFGTEEKNLATLIDNLQLGKNVFLKGFEKNIKNIYETSAFSILTSRSEGFGLVILESLAHGCPVISYDIKYGPSDMIKDGENGFLVGTNNIDKLAEKIKYLLDNSIILKEMSNYAYESVKNFDNQTFLHRWASLFQKIIEQSKYKNSISDFQFNLLESNWSDKEKGFYKVSGSMKLMGISPENTEEAADVILRIRNRENKEFVDFKMSKQILKCNQWLVNSELVLNNIYDEKKNHEGLWDLYIILKWSNSFVETRIGNKKSEDVLLKQDSVTSINGFQIQPYFTNPYGNLTFKIE
jgi:glycosyltransferase involved in cell wall biosynthesis